MRKIHLLIGGLLVGVAACEAIIIYKMRKTCGTLQIDQRQESKDSYRFVIDNLDELSNKKIIRLKVDNNADLSQK